MGNYAYVEPFSPAFGTGYQDAFEHLCGLTADELAKNHLSPGQYLYHAGRRFQVVLNRTGSALAQGDLVTPYIGAAGRVGNLTANSTKAVLETDDTFTANALIGRPDYPSWVFVTAGTGIHQFARILDNSDDASASTITVAKYDSSLQKAAVDSAMALDTAPDATSDYSVFLPWEVKQLDAATVPVTGAALAAIPDGEYGIIQTDGIGLAKIIGSTDATTVYGPLVPSATAGTGKGPTTAGITATEASLVFGRALYVFSGAAAAIVVNLQCGQFNPIAAADYR